MSATSALPVLLVDDDEALTRTLRDILKFRGFAPETAMDGKGALSVALEMQPPPRVAVVDLRLPDMDGLDLASKLQSQSHGIQVIILTGNASVDSALRAVRDQDCDYLVKPVQPDELIRTIRAAEGRWLLDQAEHLLHRSQATLQAVFEASPLPMAVLDPDLTVRMWNRAAENVFGWMAAEILEKKAPAGLPDDRALGESIVAAAMRGEAQTGIEIRCQRRDGELLDMRISVAGLAGSDGTVEALLAIYEDITQERRIAARLQQSGRMDALGRLAGGIAHDFNNLLGVMRTEIDLAVQVEEMSQQVRGTLQMVSETADRGAALTRQLLAFARRQPMEKTVVELDAVVTGIARMLERLVSDRVRIQMELGSDAGRVRVDRGQLEQVVTNLVANARDAMPQGGKITITTTSQRVAPGDTEPNVEPGDWVILAVTDTGSGIPEEIRPRIFEPFFTTKEEGSGTGLGLATSYGIVRKLGGEIAVESEVGVGTTFRIYLPKVEELEKAQARGAPVDIPKGTETILLVEDHPELRSSTLRILTRQGYTVTATASCAEARQALVGMVEPPSLVICDAHLPDGDGRDLLKEIGERYPGTRALLTSGSFEVAGRDDLNVAFLEKPFTLGAVAKAVRDVLDA